MGASRYIAVFSSSPGSLFKTAHQLAPRVEVCPPDGILLEFPARSEQDTVNRLARLNGTVCQVGGGSSRTVAILAARTRPGTIVAHGHEADFLAGLPIAALQAAFPVDSDTLTILQRWGIDRLGRLARLPSDHLASRLGQAGLQLQKIARGEDIGFFSLHREEKSFELTRQLEWELDSLEPLSFVLAGMLENLCGQLRQRGLAADALSLSLHLGDKSRFHKRLQLAVPMLDSKVLLSLLRLDLQEAPPRAPIAGVTLRAEPARRRVSQSSLLEPPEIPPEKLSHTVERLRRVVGRGNVGYPQPTDTHRPDSFLLRSPPAEYRKTPRRTTPFQPGAANSVQLTLRRFRPPEPTRLDSSRILYCAGPWRSSGNWWRPHEADGAWHRDEWDVELRDGGIYRVFWDFERRQWFREGVYD